MRINGLTYDINIMIIIYLESRLTAVESGSLRSPISLAIDKRITGIGNASRAPIVTIKSEGSCGRAFTAKQESVCKTNKKPLMNPQLCLLQVQF